MHPNPIFRQEDTVRALALVEERGFGTLAVTGPEGVLLSHVPVLLEGDRIALHLVRSNPIARALREGPLSAVVAVQGPDGYISPDWYGVADQVPTWNYTAVHLRGALELRPQEEIRDLLARQSAAYESRLAPKRPWTMAKMTPEALDRMLRQIVPCEMRIESVESTFKLGQNKTEEARLAAADDLESAGFGQETASLAALMRGV